ncbi:hypothetical protein RhiirA5_406334 [Rhizophagus irregularis]|uniref:Uncharacterized protein n=1 Tax=Rhizophagus irregularis TaxID=588596 RepID=A0A2N0SLC5_9GLOM|nr:hypothetical protein RhiirA5_406334 [Rhizophagus irregularis]PKC76372.1 hypothetical protein RhiirA1_447666 [Rhizophagus irregularis]
METNEEKHEFIVEFSRNISQLDIDNERDNINDNNIKEIEKIEEIEEENIRGRCRSSDSGSGSSPDLKWIQKYGNIVKYHGLFKPSLSQIQNQEITLNHVYEYIKPPKCWLMHGKEI